MASSSSLSVVPFPSNALSGNWDHDVFPSFHGPDVRKSFLSHILKEFRSKGIDSFIDNEIERGESISPALKHAIRGSKIAIVLLSRNYASSSWCLEELVEIMNKVRGQTVLAVFYDVDPTDVKKQTGDFGKVFEEICQGKTEEKIKTWRRALEGVATIAGYHSRNWVDEAAMIETITHDISKILNHFTHPSDFEKFVGMGAHMEEIGKLLCLKSNEVRMIGIWGPPGIGKSTIASVVYNQLSGNFQHRALMLNIKKNYPRPCLDEGSAQLQLHNQMLSHVLNQKGIEVSHVGVAKERLKNKKVLLVLDDVDQLAQLDALAGKTGWFGSGSRIIIITEDLRVLKAQEINHIYNVDFPSTDEALQIFCLNAFCQKSPKDDFEKLAHEVTWRAGALPLGLKVLGSYFRGMTKEEWTNELPRIESRLNGDIESTLRFSYDALFEEDKDLFLHIACFFNHSEREEVEACLAQNFRNVRQGLQVLSEKSLITIRNGYVQMHHLLARLGRETICKQFGELGRRPFLVDAKDICKVLSDSSTDSRSVVGIDFSYNEEEVDISERAFDRMSSLQFLRLHGDMAIPEISPKLRVLEWMGCTLTCLTFIINTKFLVKLKMTFTKLERLWEEIKPLQNLKWMDLGFSKNLKELSDFSTASSLNELNLFGCSSLVSLPYSIGNAINLQKLCLRECSSLVSLPSFIGNAISFKKLALTDCSSLVELPVSIGNAINLEQLDLSGCSSLVKLPFSIGNVVNLGELLLTGCSSLMELPSSIANAINLTWLDISGCKELVSLPELPSSLILLEAKSCESLERLDCSFCNPDIICLNFSNCFKLNKEARDLVIQTTTVYANSLPGGEIPNSFTYRDNGGSLIVKFKERSLPSSVRFKVCVLLDTKNDVKADDEELVIIDYVIMDKQSNNNDVSCGPKWHEIPDPLKEHLYIFELKTNHVTSTDLLFELRVNRGWDIKESGIMEIVESESRGSKRKRYGEEEEDKEDK